MNHESCESLSNSRIDGTLRGRARWLTLALVCGAGCAAEAPRELGAEHFAGDAADPAPEVHTGTIATAAGTTEVRYELIDGHAVVDGDIVIPPGDFIDPHASRAATVTRNQRWNGGVVPYVIDSALPNQTRVTSAIAHWHQYTAIRLVPRTTETDYVRFVVGTGCSSYVGRIGGAQSISLHADCSTGNAIHEIGHAVGLWHEQSRQDRDGSVVIYSQNVQSGYLHNFDKYGSGMDAGAYDVGSIMHYSSYAFSSNGQPTILKRDGGVIQGQRNGLSRGDILGVNILYATPAAGDDMASWEMLAPEQSVKSGSGAYELKYQGDGNLVLYRTSNGAALWASNTNGTAAGACIMQPDGNLVIYKPDGAPIWASNTAGRWGSHLSVQNDGNVVIYTSGGQAVWATNTNQ